MKIKISRITIDAVIVFLALFFNNETLSNNYCQFMEQPVRLVTVLVVLYGIYSMTKGKVKHHRSQNAVLLSIVLMALVLIALFNDSSYTNGYLLTWMSIISGMIIATCLEYDRFCYLYSKIMVIVSVVSLVCTYLIQMLFPNILSLFGIITNSAGVSFHNLYVCYIVRSSSFYRNLGIFREPGVYAIFLCMALIMLLRELQETIDRKRTIRDIVIISITILTTFSTTGYISFILIILFHLMFGKGKENSKRKNTGGMVIFLLALGIAFYVAPESDTIINPFSKLTAGSSGYSSFTYRMETIINGVSLILRNPLGYGLIKGNDALREASTTLRFHNTNTWISFALYFGILFLVVSYIGMWKNMKKHLNNGWYILAFLLLLSGEVVIYNSIIYSFIFYGFITNTIDLDEKTALT